MALTQEEKILLRKYVCKEINKLSNSVNEGEVELVLKTVAQMTDTEALVKINEYRQMREAEKQSKISALQAQIDELNNIN